MKTSIKSTTTFLVLFLIILFPIIGFGQSNGYNNDAEEEYHGFYLVYAESENSESLRILDLILADEDLLNDIINELNDYIEMPIDVPIIFGDCGEENAFFDRNENRIIICNEMILLMERIFISQGMTGDDLEIAVANATFSILLHEVGHSLVHILDLPITGSEEDAVDQFSVASLMNFEDLSQDAMIHFASFWGGLSQLTETDASQLPFWGVHSLSAQRFYNILCLTFGSDPETFGYLVEQGILPDSRAGGCSDELDRVLYAWSRLLEEHVRQD